MENNFLSMVDFFFLPLKFFFLPWKIFSYHGGFFSFHGKIFSSMVKLFSFHGRFFSFHGRFFFGRTLSNKTFLLTQTKRVINGSPSGGRTGAWGLSVSWGWSHRTSPKEQTARKRGGRGDCACWLGAFLGWSHRTSTRKHPASMRSKQGVKQGSPKKSNIKPARNAREEAPKRVTWEPLGADGIGLMIEGEAKPPI